VYILWCGVCVLKSIGKFLVLCGDLLQDAAWPAEHRSTTDGLQQNFPTTTLLSTPLNTALGIRAIARLRPAHIAHILV
jgi:hypothetical protein